MNLNAAQTRYELQQELEVLSVERGVARYREALAKNGTSAVSAGAQLIKAAMQPMEQALKSWLEETAQGLASRSASLYHFINQLDTLPTSWITAHAALNLLHERPPLTRVALQVASAMEQAVNVDAIAKANPKLAAKVAKQIERMGAERNKAVFIRKGGELADVKMVQWDDAVRVRIGTLLLTMFVESTGLVAIETMPIGRGKTQTVLRPTESCRRWLDVSHARCELLAPDRLPMVYPPKPWTNPFNGGYLSHALRQPLVKTRNKGYLTELKEWDMPWVYGAVNALQKTEWAVNTAVYEVMVSLWESNRTDAGLPSREPLPLPAKGWGEGEEPSKEVLHAWKVDAARTYEENKRLESKRLQFSQKLWVAEMMLERGNRFHYVYNLDWRGRMYPVGPALTPQGDDTAKALLRFSRGCELGENGAYWLAIHGANSFGVDKVSFEERIQWVEDNTDRILEAAQAPTTGTMWWADADSPFVFLAFCMEWADLQRHVNADLPEALFVSHLAVAFDGSCNGLQNFSALLRDPVGGAATGLVPCHKPSDIYMAVAKAAKEIVDRDALGGDNQEVALRWVDKLNDPKLARKLAKRNTMTVPYGVTRRGMRDQLFGELEGSAPEHRGEDATYLAACNFEAIGNVVVAARQAMDWLREVSKVAASTELPVRWTTPSGMLVVQDYRDAVGEELDFQVLGRRYRLMLAKTGEKLSARRQALGISPNFVHSLDAAHLMRTVMLCAQDGMKDFAMIHDSYGVHAGRAAQLRDNLRDAFVDQYRADVLAEFRDELSRQLTDMGRLDLVEELPPLPEMGTLDLEQVKQSEYFFA